MNCRVVVEAAVPVYDVGTADEAVRIAISKTGEMLNPDLNYVEINMSERVAPGAEHPAFIVADEALVALDLEMTVFNVDGEEHASRIARKEIGQRLENIPLKVVAVEVIEEDQEADGEDEGEVEAERETDEGVAEGSTDDEPTGEHGTEEMAEDDPSSTENEGDDEDPLPEFEDLL